MFLHLGFRSVPGFFRIKVYFFPYFVQQVTIVQNFFAIQLVFAVVGAHHKVYRRANNRDEYRHQYISKGFCCGCGIINNMQAHKKDDDGIAYFGNKYPVHN